MRKNLGGVKGHFRPVYDQRAAGTTVSNSYQNVLDITGRGKVAVITNNYSWIAGWMDMEVYVDGGATYFFVCRGNTNCIRCDFHFAKSIRVRHRIQPGSGGTVRTDVSYWRL